MTKVILASRLIMGLIFVVFGLNGFFNFLPMPPPPESALKFIMAMTETGYLLKVVKALEIVAGALLISGFFIPLALTLLGPIVVNILLFHIFLAPEGMPMTIALVVMYVVLVYGQWGAFKSLLKA